jgi:2-succinyl-6-hydroxy-2,4-cyclohexadiene-1-carboxylate synthase
VHANADDSFSLALDDVAGRLLPQWQTGCGVLYGYSMGARVALALVASGRVRPVALVLESANAGLETDAERRARAQRDDDDRAALIGNPAGFLRAFWQRPMFASLASQPDRAAQLTERIARAQRDPVGLAEAVRAMSLSRQPSLWDSLAELSVPLLLVSGALDDTYTTLASRMRARAPRAQHVVIERAGHHPSWEAPAAVADVVTRWLSTSVDGGGSA